MYDKCIMTWKTFLELFKEHYDYFKYKDGNWWVKTPEPLLGIGYYTILCKLVLEYDARSVRDGDIWFINSFYGKTTFIEKEDLQWNPTRKNIIIY